MKKEIVQIDEERGIWRVTTTDERWYTREAKDATTGFPTIHARKSVTYIAHHYPKGKGFENYLKKNGEEADELVQLAAERGSKVHQAIEQMNKGEEVTLRSTFTNTRTGSQEELTPEEYAAAMSYRDWWNTEGRGFYTILGVEETVWPEGPGSEPGGPMDWAGTLDIYVERIADKKRGVIDIKTSKAVYGSHKVQVSALAKAKNADWGAILQVGYARNKSGYKWNDIELDFDLFLAVKKIADEETAGETLLQRDYPLSLSLNLPTEEVEPQLVIEQPETAQKVAKPKTKKANA